MKPPLFYALILTGLVSAQDSPLPVAELQRSTQVDFAKEIVPFLKKNCFACHNEKKAKADLNLESPQAMIAGGDSGPSLVPGKPMESLVFTYSAHMEDDPMPPAKNKSKAVDLTPHELALLKLWIEQGGTGDSAHVLAGPTKWENLQDDHAIYTTAISHDGRFVASGRGNRIDLYDLHQGALEASLVDPELGVSVAHRDNVHSLAFNRDGVLASGGFRNIKLWSRKSDLPIPVGKPLPELPTSLTVSTKGEWFATGDSKGNLTLRALGKTPVINLQKRHQATIRAVVFTKDDATLYSLSDDKVLLRSSTSDPKNWKEIKTLPQSTSLALLEGEQKLAVGGIDGVIRLVPVSFFDQAPETPASPPLEFKGHSAKVTSLVPFNPEGTQLLSASEDGSIRIWDLAGKHLRQINNGTAVTALAVHPVTNRIATTGANDIIHLWDAAKGSKIGDLKNDHEFDYQRASAARTRDVAKRVADLRLKKVQANEKRWNELLEQTKKQAEALNVASKEFDVKESELRKARKEDEIARHEVTRIEASEDKSPLGAAKGRAKKTSDALNKVQGEFTAAKRKKVGAERNRDLAVRDGTKAAEAFLSSQAATLEANGQLAAAEEAVKTIEESAKTHSHGAIRSLSFCADGSTLAAATEKLGVRLWSLKTMKPLDVLQRGRDTAMSSFAPSGELVTAFADKSLVRFPNPSWSKTRQIGDGSGPAPFHGRVLALEFHPRGSLLASGSGIPSRSGELKLWDIHSGNLEFEIPKPHNDTITGFAFSPDGSSIASSSTDRLIKVHQLDTGALIHKLEGHTNFALDVAWSADGQTIASAGADKLTKLWNAETGKQTKSEGGSRKEFTSIQFLESGNSLLTATGENTVKLGNQNLGGIQGFVYTATASQDGQIIVAGGEDGILRVWTAKDRKLLYSFPPPKSKSRSAH